jgi:hypothetical protein
VGAQKKAAYEAERRAASGNADKPARVGGTQEIDPASSNRTVRAAPLAGTAPNPFGGPQRRRPARLPIRSAST